MRERTSEAGDRVAHRKRDCLRLETRHSVRVLFFFIEVEEVCFNIHRRFWFCYRHTDIEYCGGWII